MRVMLLILANLGFFHFTQLSAQSGIYINEAMGSNKTTIADSTGEFEDWLELYNANSSAKALNGYYLSNDITKPQLFRLSGNLQIPAHGYLLLWASKDTTRGKTHLPFKISALGERLFMYAPDGHTLVDSLNIGQQKTDVSYGRTKDGLSTFGFFAKPTPQSTNNSSTAYAGILDAPVFSKPAGFYGSLFSLSITSNDPAAKIVYTTDGSNPDAGNIGGTVYRYKNQYQKATTDPVGPFLLDSFRSLNYTGPLTIKDATANPNRISLKSSTFENTYSYAPTTLINKGTVVRAVATKSGYIPSEITTATYWVTSGGSNKYTVPVLSIAVPENYLYNWDSGVYVAGTDFEKWRALNPTATPNGGSDANWNRETQARSSFELFAPNAESRQLQTDIDMCINGNWSRSAGQKAFRVYFRSSYGAADLNYKIFSDLPFTNYERLVLSNAGNDMAVAHMNDMAGQACMKNLNMGTQHQQPAITFVNGEFWGFLNIRQRYDDNHFKQIYGIDPDSLDFGENLSVVNNGTGTAMTNLRNFISSNDMTITANYNNIQTQMDVDNFIDYQIAEIYLGNTDWPQNNISYFRKRVPYTPGDPLGQDGRFRWTLNDVDQGLGRSGRGGVDYNTLAWATGTSTTGNPTSQATVMLRKLLTNPEFKNKFITRYADLLNTSFLPSNMDSIINSYRDILSPHMAEHTQRWRHPSSTTGWNNNVNNMVKYADGRQPYVRQHIRDYFSLTAEKQVTINVSDPAQGFVKVNTIDLTPAWPGVPQNTYPWTGSYYAEVPVTLVAKPKPGYRFVGWTGDATSTNDSIIVTLTTNKTFTAVFEAQPTTDPSKVIVYWHFNNQPTGTLTTVAADTSLTGNAVITYPGTGAGFMDRTTATSPSEGSTLNLQFNQLSGWSLRARNPSSSRYLLITAPTLGYKNVVLKYATSRTSSGAQYQRVFYTNDVTAANPVWILKADNIALDSAATKPELNFLLQTFDFSSDVNTVNNPNFAVKVEFFGSNATGSSGNDRFDNITFSGVALSSSEFPTVSVSSDKNNVCATSQVTFTAKTTNAGSSPVFQWFKNDVNVGTNQNKFVDNSFQNGDVVYCKLTVNGNTLTSNKITITVVSSDLSITSLTKDPPSACGNNDGDIIINRTGGSSPFQYSLDNANYFNSNAFSNLGAGSYTAYVKDSKGCIASLTDALVKIPTLTISVTKTSPSACGGNNGKITISQTGGNAPFTYSINGVNYVTSNVFSNLAAGTYTAYVKDADDCITSVSTALANASALVINSLSKINPSGCNTKDGKITINSSGGTAPFTYSINGVNYVSSNVFSNLASGSYTAYVKDASGCTASFADVLSNNSTLTVTGLTTTAPTACNKNDGGLTVSISGGSAPFRYSLDNVNFVSSNVFSSLAPGTYTAYVTDGSGCTASLSDVVDKFPTDLEILALKTTPAAACRDDGTLEVINFTGAAPFLYSLNNGEYVSDNKFSNLAAGTYKAYVLDGNGCVDSLTEVINKVSPIIVSFSQTPATACSNDGTITVNALDGTAPYQYSLNNIDYSTNSKFFDLLPGAYTAYVKDDAGCVDSVANILTKIPIGIAVNTIPASACNDDGSITISNSAGTFPFTYSLDNVNYVTTNVFSNLSPGRYTAYIMDANGCIDSISTEVSKPSPLTITSLTIKGASACNDDGSITINKSGGTSPYQYSLDGVSYVSSNQFTGLKDADYTAYVKDASGCIASLGGKVSKALTLTISLGKTNPSACANNGSITINKAGGTAPFTYSLDGVNYVSGNVFSNLSAGSFTAYVKDASGCIASTTDALDGTPSIVITSLTKTSPTCSNDGSIIVNSSGGTAPFTYSLNGVNYVSSNVFSNLASGNYTAYVKDANGCVGSLSDVLTGASTLVITSLTKTNPSACANNGSITINRTGGTSPFTYSLDGVTYVTSNVFSNLAGGTYTAYVKDAKGCIATTTGTLVKPAALTITSLSKTSPACANNGSITVNISGGTSPFTYSLGGVNYVSSNVFSNLAAATYTAYVKDANGCVTSLATTLTSATSMTVSLSATNPSACANNGSITINKSGGTSPYTYSLNGTTYVTSNVFSNLAAGTYTGYVKDAKGCIASASVTLTKPAALVASLGINNPSACANIGKISIYKTGGTSPYTYSLDGVTYSTTDHFYNLAAGTYTGYVKDARGCISSATTTLVKPAALVASLGINNPSACANDGKISVYKSGGSSPYTYSLDGVTYVTTYQFTNLAAGTYTGYVKDAKGCISSATTTLTKPAALVITSVTKVNPTACSKNGKLTINRTGGTSPFTYSLDGVTYVTSNVFSNLAGGTYTAYVKDAKGCVAKLANITLTAPVCATTVAANQKTIMPSATFGIKVYPNPFAEQFSLIVESSDNKEVDVVLTDLVGRKIFATRTAPNNTLTFGKGLINGTYIIEARQGTQMATYKIVKAQ